MCVLAFCECEERDDCGAGAGVCEKGGVGGAQEGTDWVHIQETVPSPVVTAPLQLLGSQTAPLVVGVGGGDVVVVGMAARSRRCWEGCVSICAGLEGRGRSRIGTHS